MKYNNYGNTPAAFAFVSPDGKVYRGSNIRRFAREQGLDPANMQHVHDGERSHHKGWRALEDYEATAP